MQTIIVFNEKILPRTLSFSRSCFKIVDQVQDQGVTNCSTTGICVIFRGLNDLSQHRDCPFDCPQGHERPVVKANSHNRQSNGALGAILKQLLKTIPQNVRLAEKLFESKPLDCDASGVSSSFHDR